jgi:hypothetical protein
MTTTKRLQKMQAKLDEAKAEILRLCAELQAIVIEAEMTDHGDGYVEVSRETINKVRELLNAELSEQP